MTELWQLVKINHGKETVYMVDSQKKVKARMTALKTSSRGKSNISFRMEIVESDTAKYKKKPCGKWNEWQSPRLTKWSK